MQLNIKRESCDVAPGPAFILEDVMLCRADGDLKATDGDASGQDFLSVTPSI
jgi:hypothetical protein